MQKVIVLFKTHLDVGFTDYSANILRDYNEKHIPRAIEIARELQERPEGYVWTVGSYLIHQYLKTASEEKVQEMEEAIRKGWISYHGLPFTTHTELMDERLFQYGLSIAAKLDRRFEKKTIAAKMTDVPGHTVAMVPYLRKAGIEFLHIGVNSACPAPMVPDLFQWQGPDGSKVAVMYSKSGYGNVMCIPHTSTYVYFAHTNDNQGPQSKEEVLEVYERLHQEYPNARIIAGDLNDVAMEIRPVLEKLPVVTQEIGDTWIHGGATDPQKLNQYRALLRMGRTLKKDDAEALYEGLIMVPEHTWGMDTKLYLNDPEHYDKASFNEVRAQGRYDVIEASWEEQRDYVRNAIGNLRRPLCFDAENLAAQYRIPYPKIEGMPAEIAHVFNINGWIFQIGGQGAIVYLENEGVTYADESHRLGVFRYEVFSEKEVLEFQDRYMVNNFDWAISDLGKTGLASGIDHYHAYGVKCGNVWRDKEHVYVELIPEEEAVTMYGCPPGLLLVLTPEEKQFKIDLTWYDKPALRIPEALWFGFSFPQAVSGIEKLGYYIDPCDVVKNGNHEMHATQGGIRFGGYQMESLDAAIVSIGRQSCYSFREEKPNPELGIWMNLVNNQWGTNFPMWSEGDNRFRFIIQKRR